LPELAKFGLEMNLYECPSGTRMTEAHSLRRYTDELDKVLGEFSRKLDRRELSGCAWTSHRRD